MNSAKSAGLLLAALSLFALPVAAARAQGIFYSVDSTGDGDLIGSSNFCNDGTGHCTLRAAIHASNLHPGEDGIGIDLPPGSVINLTQSLPDITQSVSISGAGADKLTVRRDTGGNYRIFSVIGSSSVSLYAMTISNGFVSGADVAGGDGGAILAGGATTTVSVIGCTLSGNTARFDTTFSAGGFGGAVLNNGGTVNLTNCTLSGNSASLGFAGGGDSAGGAVANAGTLNVTNCTFSGNSARNGGAIFVLNGTVNVTNSTIVGNSVSNVAGGIYVRASAALNLKSSAIARNITSAGTFPSVQNMFVDAGGAVASQGFNLLDSNNSVAANFPAGNPNANNDIVGLPASPVDPGLDPAGLKYNGGPTQTVALFSSSPAIDKGTSNGLTGHLTTDQRGLARTFDLPAVANAAGGDGTDIGAFESTTLDQDGDGVSDGSDNCPTNANADQADSDSDGVGDACDNCTSRSNPRVTPNPSSFLTLNPWATLTGGQRDDDHDGYGNPCDAKFTPGALVGPADLTQFRASNGKSRTFDDCGTAGNRPCAIFDLDEAGGLIAPADLTIFRLLNAKAPGPKCAACPLLCQAGTAGACSP